jgi:energy-coupling factor transporter transmembrane protein EcfT
MAKNKLDNVIDILSCVLVVILIIVLLFTRERTNNIFQSIVIWLIVYIMSYWCTKSVHKSIGVSILLIIIISFINCRGSIVENFDLDKIEKDEHVSEEEGEGSEDFMNKKVKDTKDMIDSLDKMILNKNMDLKSTEFNALDPKEIGNMLKFSASDKESEKNGDLNSDKKNLSPAEAQRETFRLIDTVKQLDDTIKALGPTLSQGKQIMNMFDKIKL